MKKTVKMNVKGITPGVIVVKDTDGKPKGTKPVVTVRLEGEGSMLNLTGLAPDEAKGLAFGHEVSVTIES